MNIKDSYEYKLNFICKNINEVRKAYKIEFARILSKTIPKEKIREKGSGLSIKTKDISKETVDELYNYIISKIDKIEGI